MFMFLVIYLLHDQSRAAIFNLLGLLNLGAFSCSYVQNDALIY